MAKIFDFESKKVIAERAASKEFLFGDEIVRKDNSLWKGMVVEEKQDGLVVMRWIKPKGDTDPVLCYVFMGKDMVSKTGKSYTNIDRFLDWFADELKTNLKN